MTLILASKSETRRRMLEAAGVTFDVRTGATEEEAVKQRCRALGMDARTLALALAEQKALDVDANPGEFILGADQTLECSDGSMLDKPASREDAELQLRSLSGRRHWLHSAAVIAADGRSIWRSAESVAMDVRPLSDDFIHAYLDAEFDEVRYNVGCYRIEGLGAQLFDRVEGSHFAILGLPLLPLLGWLREGGLIER
jgi:septum formation protein